MEFLDLKPATTAKGLVHLPGSKSISNRTLLLAALASGITDISDLLQSDDTDRMLEALITLGVGVTKRATTLTALTAVTAASPTKKLICFSAMQVPRFAP